MKIKTDGDVMRAAKLIDKYNQKINDLLSDIQESEHPNAEAIDDDLFHQCAQLAWATHIVVQYFEHPEEWEKTEYGAYYHKRARKATETRRLKKRTRSIVQ